MSRVVDFTFNNLSRINQDEYNYTQDSLSNNAHASYMLSNLNGEKVTDVFTNYPTMNVKGTNQVGPYGFNIKESTNLLKSKLTNPNCKISLQERSYLTIPYLGRGNVDVGMENTMKFGETLKEKKSCSQLNEKEYCDLKEYPLRKELRASVSDPKKNIEELAVKGWIRGGLPSREIYKNKEYQCN
jgi:hypothetical protein|tara:strand:+ start:614 stop:1168 length:555 start_codon:yes stop_codon:yes gene_type:complete